MKKLITIVAVALLLVLALPASAMTLVTKNGIYEGTPDEFIALQGGDFTGGAISMKEGQREAVLDFEPDNNYEDNLGRYGSAFRDVYASGTLYVGKISATSSDSTVNGKKICTADGTNCAGVASASFFTNSGTNWYMTTTTPVKVGFGDTTPDAFFEIAGDQDTNQFLVTGFESQASDLVHVASSTNNVIFSIASNGNLAASGTAQWFATSTFESTAAVKVSSTLQVSHATKLYGTLAVTGATTLTGAATLSSTLGVTGATTLSSTLAVTDAVTLSSTLAVTGATTLTGLLTPNGGISTSTLDSVVIGGTTAAAGSFTTIAASGVTSLTGSLHASSTILATGLITPYGGIATSTWDNTTIGLGTQAAGAFTYVSVGTGTTSSTLRNGATATSTISSSVAITEASATSTLHIGAGGAQGQGGCIYLAASNGSGGLYLYVSGTTLQLATSTSATVCY